jgi:hypothetical protein
MLRLALATLVVGAAAIGAPSTASAGHWHDNCVWHGLVHGSSAWDNQFHSRVEAGCGNPGQKLCRLYYIDGPTGPSETIPGGSSATCNVSSYGNWGEQASYAQVDFNGVFSYHSHGAH